MVKSHNLGMYALSRTHQTAGPGESFWLLINTGAAQILSTSLAVALSCYQSNLISRFSWLIFAPISFTHLFAFWGGSWGNQSVKCANMKMIWLLGRYWNQVLNTTCLSSFLDGWRGHMGTTGLFHICAIYFSKANTTARAHYDCHQTNHFEGASFRMDTLE